MANKSLNITQKQIALGDPHNWTDNRDILSIRFAVYETLVSYAPDGTFMPCLAQSWNCSDDACHWTFILRNSVFFHDGRELSAADVAACLERVITPGMKGDLGTDGLYEAYLHGMSVEVTGEQSLTLHLTAPMADLLDILVYLPIIPADSFSTITETAVGTGPYRFDSQQQHTIRLVSNPKYWGEEAIYDAVVWQAEEDPEKRLQEISTGEAYISSDVSRRSLNAAGLAGIDQPSHWATIIMLNCAQGVCVDKRVRQALNYAVDVPAMIDGLLDGAANPMVNPLTPVHNGFIQPEQTYHHNPAKAKALLHEAGFGNGMHLTLDIPTVHPDESPVLAEMLKKQLADVGIELEIRPHDNRPAYSMMVRSKQIGDACIFDSSPLSSYRTLREKFHSGIKGPWWEGYHNPSVNQMMETAWRTPQYEERTRLYQRVTQTIYEDAPWIFLYSPIFTWGISEKMQNWQPTVHALVRV